MAEDIALILQPGDVVAVSGKLGAGKTAFCRALIRTLAKNDTLEIPSPTFTLVQQYDLERFTLAHFDLYRIGNSEELIELGFEDFVRNSVVLVEWPEKAETFLPKNNLWMSIATGDTESKREVEFFGEEQIWQSRLNRTIQIRKFLTESGWPAAKRRFLEGDASTRSYETIHENARSVVFMNAKPPPAEGAIRDEKSYSEIAKLSQSLDSFIAIDQALERAGVRVPKIYNVEKSLGFMILENLGNEPVVKDSKPILERYVVATEVLAFLHGKHWTPEIETSLNESYRLPHYDNEAMLIEVELFLDWFVPFNSQHDASTSSRQKFIDIWEELINKIKDTEKSIVLRDYHSPNLLWQENESHINQVGLIDFQDAVFGPVVYDLVSLVQDARVNVDLSLQERITQHYLNLRSKQGNNLNEIEFTRDFAIVASQRALKILGIFTRLSQRDGKHNYLRHIPRVSQYLAKNLQNESLAELLSLFENENWLNKFENPYEHQ